MNFYYKVSYKDFQKKNIVKKEGVIEADTEDDAKASIAQEIEKEPFLKVVEIFVKPIVFIDDLQATFGSRYVFKVKKIPTGLILEDNAITFKLKHITVKSDSISCHLIVTTNILASNLTTIYNGNFNFLSERTCSSLARRFEQAMPQEKFGINWNEYIQEVKHRVLEEIEQGEPVVTVDEIDNDEEVSYLSYPFIVKGVPNMIFGKGGDGKTTFSTLLAVGGAIPEIAKTFHISKQFNALYLDYENSKPVIYSTIKLLSQYIDKKKFFYRRCYQPLKVDFEKIVEIVVEKDIELIIIDSVALACGSLEVEAVINFFQYLNQIPSTSLLIAHIPKHSTNENTPYGSVYFYNLVRNAWSIKKKVLSEKEYIITLKHEKCNIAPLLIHPKAYKLSINDTIQVSSKIIDFNDATELTDVDLSYIIVNFLKKKGAKTPLEISKELDINYNTVKTTLRRLIDKNIVIKIPDGNSVLYAIKADEPF